MYKANSFMRPNRMTIKQNKRISQSLEYGIKAGKSKSDPIAANFLYDQKG